MGLLVKNMLGAVPLRPFGGAGSVVYAMRRARHARSSPSESLTQAFLECCTGRFLQRLRSNMRSRRKAAVRAVFAGSLVADVAMLVAGRVKLCRNITWSFRKAEARVFLERVGWSPFVRDVGWLWKTVRKQDIASGIVVRGAHGDTSCTR
jgi:hypothetical protein